MAWEEWEQLKAAAAERQGTHMELNQLAANRSGSKSELISNKAAWTKLGTDVGSLREDIGKATTKPRTAKQASAAAPAASRLPLRRRFTGPG
ncbi:hypothetical protein [Streptomyces sp. NPDC059906]|uniref:hypothetical protein n=1 Tax=Streptomyces sp. NPDC059906 TaxID=3346997 RepID=UPI00364BD6F3